MLDTFCDESEINSFILFRLMLSTLSLADSPTSRARVAHNRSSPVFSRTEPHAAVFTTMRNLLGGCQKHVNSSQSLGIGR